MRAMLKNSTAPPNGIAQIATIRKHALTSSRSDERLA